MTKKHKMRNKLGGTSGEGRVRIYSRCAMCDISISDLLQPYLVSRVPYRISRFGFRILLEVHMDPRIGLRSNIQFFQFLIKLGTGTRKYAMTSVCRDELLPDP